MKSGFTCPFADLLTNLKVIVLMSSILHVNDPLKVI